jgi:hypothetical protein
MVESSVSTAPRSDCIYLIKNVKFVPAASNNSQDNVNCLLNSSTNYEYILLVYDSAVVFNVGRFGMYVTGFFRRDLKSASNSFARSRAVIPSMLSRREVEPSHDSFDVEPTGSGAEPRFLRC